MTENPKSMILIITSLGSLHPEKAFDASSEWKTSDIQESDILGT